MSRPPSAPRWLLGLALAALLAAGSDSQAEEAVTPALSFEDLAQRAAPAILPVRGVATVHISLMGQAQSMEIDLEATGVVVDPSGLFLVSNTALGGTSSPILRQLEEALGGAKISVDVQRLRVQLPDEAEERDALIVLRDPITDLAWLQVLDLSGRVVPAVDLAQGGEVRVGARIVGVTRRDRMFDHAPSLTHGYVCGRVTTPRLLWGVAGEFAEIGHVAFDRAGRPLGVLVPHMEAGAEDPDVGLFLLPLDAVQKSREAAKAKVAEALEAHAKAKAEGAGEATPPDGRLSPPPEAPAPK